MQIVQSLCHNYYVYDTTGKKKKHRVVSIANSLTSVNSQSNLIFFVNIITAMSIDRDRHNALLVECMRSLDSINYRDAIRKRASKRAKSAKIWVFAKFHWRSLILHRQNGISLVIYSTDCHSQCNFELQRTCECCYEIGGDV